MKKVLALLLGIIMVFSFTACNGPKGSDSVIKIGVIQFVQHDALDSAYKGFVDGLKEAGYEEGKNIKIDLQNAQGEAANTASIASKLVNDKNDLILAIATPAALAVANATEDIPILFTAVTDAVDAGLVVSNEAPGGNVSGTSDLTPVKEQIQMIPMFVPDAKVVGVLYCSNEQNSYVQAQLAKSEIEALGLEYKEFTVSETSQIPIVTQAAVGQVDALYTPTDNVIAAAMVQISGIATENGVPLIGGEEAQVDNGALASFGINYYELGKITAAQAVRILKDGEKISAMPVEYQQDYKYKINRDTLDALGLELPEDIA